MIQPGSGKALANERKYPNIVELVVPDDGLEVELSSRIMEFHRRWTTKDNHTHCRWCFADLGTACDFIEQFGGSLHETGM